MEGRGDDGCSSIGLVLSRSLSGSVSVSSLVHGVSILPSVSLPSLEVIAVPDRNRPNSTSSFRWGQGLAREG